MRIRSEDWRSRARICLGLAAVLCAVFFWQLGDSVLTGLERVHGGSYELRVETAPLSASDVTRIAERTEDLVTAWTQRNGTTVERTDHSAKVPAPAVLFSGDNQAEFQLNSDRGCVISSALAQALWGTSQVAGERLLLFEQEYLVERVENGKQPRIMARIPEEPSGKAFSGGLTEASVSFDVLTVKPADPGLGDAIQTFESEQGISSDLSFGIDDMIGLFKSLRVLPLWGLMAAAAGILCGKGRRAWQRGERRKAFARCAGALGLLLFCGFLAGSPLTFPESLVPTRWSDFEFWKRTVEEMGRQWSYLTSMERYLPDLELRRGGGTGVACGGVAVGFLIAGLLLLRGPLGKMRKNRKP